MVSILGLSILGCSDKGTQAETEAESSSSSLQNSVVSSSLSNLSSSLEGRLSSSSNMLLSSAPPTSSSGPLAISSSSRKIVSSSSMPHNGSSSSVLVPSSSSFQALQFLGKQVRIPDGCGLIRWASGDTYTCVKDFWVDTVEVSIGEFQAVLGGGIPSLYRTGFYLWPSQTGTGYADDGTPCPNCPADAVTIYEAMLYANAITKQKGNPSDTVYSYSRIDTADAPGYFTKAKIKEIVALQNLVIREEALGYRLPTQGEFEYMSLKSDLDYVPWEDLYPDSSVTWLLGTEANELFVSPEYVPPQVGSKRHTSWFLHDLKGSAWEWTTTRHYQYTDQYIALGNAGDVTTDLRMDSDRAGFRLVRGTRTERVQRMK